MYEGLWGIVWEKNTAYHHNRMSWIIVNRLMGGIAEQAKDFRWNILLLLVTMELLCNGAHGNDQRV